MRFTVVIDNKTKSPLGVVSDNGVAYMCNDRIAYDSVDDAIDDIVIDSYSYSLFVIGDNEE